MFAFLHRPYPAPESTNNGEIVSRAFIAGLVVASVLMIVQPFGLDRINFRYPYLTFAGYGLITSVAILFNHFVIVKNLPNLFREKNWKLYKELLFQFYALMCIGLFNGIYNSFTTGQAYDLNSVLGMMINTAIIGIFPLAAFVIIDHYRLVKKFTRQSAVIENSIQTQNNTSTKTIPINPVLAPKRTVTLSGTQENEELVLPAEDLLYVASQANYATIHFRQAGAVERKIFRTTLTNIQSQLKGQSSIMRCHRSFIVNLEQVVSTEGNAQGLRLKMKDSEDVVSVSRKYVPLVRSWFS